MIPSKGAIPFKWPFPPRPKAPVAAVPRRHGTQAGQGAGARPAGGLTRKAMLADVVLVIFWGASIPGLMWLGAAGGF